MHGAGAAQIGRRSVTARQVPLMDHCNCRCQASEKLEFRKEREGTMYALQAKILLSLFIIHYLQTCWGSRETLSIAHPGMPTSQRRDVGGGSVAYCGSRDNGALVSPTWHGFSTPRANALTPLLSLNGWSWRVHSLDHLLPGHANTPSTLHDTLASLANPGSPRCVTAGIDLDVFLSFASGERERERQQRRDMRKRHASVPVPYRILSRQLPT